MNAEIKVTNNNDSQYNWNTWNKKVNNFAKYSHIKSPLIYGTPSETIPEVSFIIPAYKRADVLKRSLETALKQDYKDPYEILVVDDSGFSQETDALMKEYCEKYDNVLYYRNEVNIGTYANWNRACELCRTEWFCLLHDDDGAYENYLTTTMNFIKSSAQNVGLLGVYYNTLDERTTVQEPSIYKKTFDNILKLFVKLRKCKPIKLTLEDHANHIFIMAQCMMINKQKVLEIGGIDDVFFPSSDYVFCSKMSCFYDIVFLPEFLCFRGVAENESLKETVCRDSIIRAYHITEEIIKYTKPNASKSYIKRRASFAAVCAEIGVIGYNNIDYSSTKSALGMNKIYNYKFVRFLIAIKSKTLWGLLLFRKNYKKVQK